MTNLGADVQIPYLDGEEVEGGARNVLDNYWDGNFPIDVEKLCDSMDIGVIFIPGLRKQINVEAYITSDFRTVVADEKCAVENEARYRFSVAHELGHMVLHGDYYPSNIDSIESYLQNLSEYRNSVAERQADQFAASLLVPRDELCKKMKEYFGDDIASGVSGKGQPEKEKMYSDLMRTFGVSNMVMARRIQDCFPDLMGEL